MLAELGNANAEQGAGNSKAENDQDVIATLRSTRSYEIDHENANKAEPRDNAPRHQAPPQNLHCDAGKRAHFQAPNEAVQKTQIQPQAGAGQR